MQLSTVLNPLSKKNLRVAAQCGVEGYVALYPGPRYEDLLEVKQRVEKEGLRLVAIEGFLPIEKIKLGTDHDGAELEAMKQLIEHMGHAGVPVLCYNWMTGTDWVRTKLDVPERGGARVTAFNLKDAENAVNFPDAHLPFLRQAGGRPATVQTGVDVEMLPWVGADSPRLREVMADYYNCMARLDDWVGLLLESLRQTGAMENTMIIYIGDHGAQFPRGKGTVYEAGLRIPYIIRWPGRTKAGTVREELVSTVDLLPTILDAAKVEVPSSLSGLKLQPLFSNSEVEMWRRYIYAMTTGSFPGNYFLQFSIRDERFKLILSPRPGEENYIAHSYLNSKHPFFVDPGVRSNERATVSDTVEKAYRRWGHSPRYELYDLQKDPYEWYDLADDFAYAETKQRLMDALYQFRHDTRDPFLDSSNLETFTKEQLANRDMAYRKQENFHWTYLDTFRKWRARQLERSEP